MPAAAHMEGLHDPTLTKRATAGRSLMPKRHCCGSVEKRLSLANVALWSAAETFDPLAPSTVAVGAANRFHHPPFLHTTSPSVLTPFMDDLDVPCGPHDETVAGRAGSIGLHHRSQQMWKIVPTTHTTPARLVPEDEPTNFPGSSVGFLGGMTGVATTTAAMITA